MWRPTLLPDLTSTRELRISSKALLTPSIPNRRLRVHQTLCFHNLLPVTNPMAKAERGVGELLNVKRPARTRTIRIVRGVLPPQLMPRSPYTPDRGKPKQILGQRRLNLTVLGQERVTHTLELNYKPSAFPSSANPLTRPRSRSTHLITHCQRG